MDMSFGQGMCGVTEGIGGDDNKPPGVSNIQRIGFLPSQKEIHRNPLILRRMTTLHHNARDNLTGMNHKDVWSV